ncbi:MAG: hypothetical protein VXW65_09770 [Pseudomonadota bacterium]|nr:hypothetical protein [Pseudomonadota bacterium]
MKSTQTLNISPWFKESRNTTPLIPNRLNVSVINHQDIILTADNLSAHIHGDKVQSVKFNYFGLDPSSSITRLVYVNYECQKTACQGAQVDPNGFGVKFNNTTLSQVGSDGMLNPTITLNGGLVYLGR